MALSYKARRRWSLVILLLGLPIYIILAVAAVAALNALIGRPPLWAEFAVFATLGVVWAFPFKFVFMGIGQADPDAPDPADEDADR